MFRHSHEDRLSISHGCSCMRHDCGRPPRVRAGALALVRQDLAADQAVSAAVAPRMSGQGDLRLVLLDLIAEKPRHGADLMRAIEENLWVPMRPAPVRFIPP